MVALSVRSQMQRSGCAFIARQNSQQTQRWPAQRACQATAALSRARGKAGPDSFTLRVNEARLAN